VQVWGLCCHHTANGRLLISLAVLNIAGVRQAEANLETLVLRLTSIHPFFIEVCILIYLGRR
jgi:hypothetical protein